MNHKQTQLPIKPGLNFYQTDRDIGFSLLYGGSEIEDQTGDVVSPKYDLQLAAIRIFFDEIKRIRSSLK